MPRVEYIDLDGNTYEPEFNKTTAHSIIHSARYHLADIKKAQWTDSRLLSILNEGLVELAELVPLFVKEDVIATLPYQREFDIEDSKFIKVLRLRYDDKPLPIKTIRQMDKYAGWESKTGKKIEALVFNQNKINNFKIYPLITFEETKVYDSLTGTNGVLIDIPGVSRDSLTGVVRDINTTEYYKWAKKYQPIAIKPDGTIAIVEDGYHNIQVTYSLRHPPVELLRNEIPVDKLVATALSYYIAAIAGTDENRGEILNKSMLFFDKYRAEVEVIKTKYKDFYDEVAELSVSYKTGFEKEFYDE